MYESAIFWLTVLFVLVFVALIVVTLLQSPLQNINNVAPSGVYKLGSATTEVLFQGTNDGTASFIMRPRPSGTMVRFWNQTPDSVTILNQSGNYPVQIGASSTGVLASYESTLCLNTDGGSSGTGSSGSWLCTTASLFA